MIYLHLLAACFALLMTPVQLNAQANVQTNALPDDVPKQQAKADEPVIAIIIDDLGQQYQPGLRTINLPGPVACSFLPYMPWGAKLAEKANSAGKEVMLHLPMQAMDTHRLSGAGEISLNNNREELQEILQQNLESIPHVQGINNHMGSLLTRHPGHMEWLMAEIARKGDLFFVDSYTTAQSIALTLAEENSIPATRRNVFLDDDPMADAIRFQFRRLIDMAVKNGSAVAIGHPYDTTLEVLEAEIPRLAEQGVRLVSIQELIELQGVQ